MGEGVLEAVAAHVAAATHLLGLPGRPTLLREEGLRVGLCTEGLLLPGQELLDLVIVVEQEAELRHGASSGVRASHRGGRARRRSAWPGAAASGRGKNTREITRASCHFRQVVRWYCLLLGRLVFAREPAIRLVTSPASRVPPGLRRHRRGVIVRA